MEAGLSERQVEIFLDALIAMAEARANTFSVAASVAPPERLRWFLEARSTAELRLW